MLNKKGWAILFLLISMVGLMIFSIEKEWGADTNGDARNVPDLVATRFLRPIDITPRVVWAGQFVPDKVVYHVVGGRFGDGFCVEVSPT